MIVDSKFPLRVQYTRHRRGLKTEEVDSYDPGAQISKLQSDPSAVVVSASCLCQRFAIEILKSP
jgi:hypothetical protein